MQSPETQHTPVNVPRHGAVQLQPTSVRPASAARLLGISEASLWRWLKQREGFPSPRRIGPRTTVFDVAELLAWRDAQATPRADSGAQ